MRCESLKSLPLDRHPTTYNTSYKHANFHPTTKTSQKIKKSKLRHEIKFADGIIVSPVAGVEILGPVSQDAKTILTNEAVEFLASLHRTFNATRKHLLKRRQLRQQQIDAGVLLDFLPETKHIRDDETWRAAIPAPGLEDRRVEITGPVDRKMVCSKT